MDGGNSKNIPQLSVCVRTEWIVIELYSLANIAFINALNFE